MNGIDKRKNVLNLYQPIALLQQKSRKRLRTKSQGLLDNFFYFLFFIFLAFTYTCFENFPNSATSALMEIKAISQAQQQC